jgi:hypothetical protein
VYSAWNAVHLGSFGAPVNPSLQLHLVMELLPGSELVFDGQPTHAAAPAPL